MKLRPYSEYKDSGVPWLGEVPAHWATQKTKYLFNERSQKGYPNEILLAATQSKGVVPKTMFETRTVTAQKDLHLLKLVEVGDFVISLRSFQGGIEQAYFRGIISPAYTVITPKLGIEREYFKHLAKSKPFLGLLKTCVTGIREGQNIDYELLRKAFLPLPRAEEQAQIARFLDWKTAQIDRFIRNKRRLIELLKEQKQALINQAVTGRIDVRTGKPYPEYKDSGVPWLGKVPTHWTPIRLKQVAVVRTGVTLGKHYSNQEQLVERPYLRVANVQAGHLVLDKVKTIQVPAREANKCLLKKGDVLVTEGGDLDKLGRGCIWNEEISGCLHQNHIFALRLNTEKLLPEFLVRFMASSAGRMYFEITGKQTTNLASTNSTTLGNLALCIPDVGEQKKIVDYLKCLENKTTRAIIRAQREIDLIQEYRTRLIADVVTGKLDVRDIEVPEIDESEQTVDKGVITGDVVAQNNLEVAM